MNYKKLMDSYLSLIDNDLKKYFIIEEPKIIYNSINYSLFSGGKRIRGILMLAVCDLFNGDKNNCLIFASALEMIHTYSLIHDDLPLMDNDDYRRGKLTNHKVFGEAIALLAGDALLNTAYEIISKYCLDNFNINNIKALNVLAKVSGTKGMIGGQVVDIISENINIDEETLNYIQENKTGKLFQGATSIGTIISNRNNDEVKLMEDLGMLIGILFQIQDDILDVTSSQKILGKPIGSDEKNNKGTYLSIFGLEKAILNYNNLGKKIKKIIVENYGDNNFLYYLVDLIIKREK